jgi:hypothetical protein
MLGAASEDCSGEDESCGLSTDVDVTGVVAGCVEEIPGGEVVAVQAEPQPIAAKTMTHARNETSETMTGFLIIFSQSPFFIESR